jgi:hypothetical protein
MATPAPIMIVPGSVPYHFDLQYLDYNGTYIKYMGKKGIIIANSDAVELKIRELLPPLSEMYAAGAIYGYTHGPRYGNRCGDNANIIISKFREARYEVAKIVIAGWDTDSLSLKQAIIENRSALFENLGMTMFTTYHAFPLFYFSDVNLFIAIETTIRPTPQFIIGKTTADIEEFIRNRYLVKDFAITQDIVTDWETALKRQCERSQGGSGRRKSKTRRLRSKSRLRKTRQWTRLR